MHVQTTWGLRLINEALNQPSAIKIDASDMTLDGFRDDTRSEYRQRSVLRTAPGGSLTCDAPSCGERYFGFVIYDDAVGAETIEIWIDGVKQGIAIADANNRRERLLTLTEPYHFQGGESIRLQTPESGGGTYRIECIAFFTALPPETATPCHFIHVHVEQSEIPSIGTEPLHTHPGRGVTTSVRLTWVTTWNSQCSVAYWAEGSLVRTVIDEEGHWANHRVVLTELLPDTTYCYRLRARDRDGNVVESDTRTFVTSPPPHVIGSTKAGRIPLTIRNSSDAPYKSVPMTHGVPFPKGVLGSSEHLRLLAPDGSEIPLQARTLGEWLDGSVKWALLDFQVERSEIPRIGTDVPQIAEQVYTLEYGTEIRRKQFDTPLAIHEDENTVTIDTGRLTIRIDKSRFAPFAEIQRDNQPYVTGSRIVVNGVNGEAYVSTNAPPDLVEIEEAGPVRCVVRVEGRHLSADGEALFQSICRIHAYAGLPFVRLEHTFVNDNAGENFTEIASMYLYLDTPLGNREEMEIRQTHDNRCVINGEIRLERAHGGSSAGGLNVAMPDFWQQYPKSLRTLMKGIEIGLCPAIDADDYRDAGEDEHKLYFYLKNGVYRFREGLSKTHTLYIGEDIPSTPTPIPQAPPEWYCDSGALGEIPAVKVGARGSRRAEQFADYEAKVSQAFDGYLKNREDGREYGMLNFGDWWGERRWNWGNSEYDTAFAFVLQWARSGDPRWFEGACCAATHHRDVDTCHASADAINVGGVYTHCIGHTGDYYPDSFRPGAISSGRFSVSHTWVDGFLLHHFLTGDRRSLETARTVADRYDRHDTRNYDFTNCRNNGWHLIHSMVMYHATRDRFYLNAAHIIVERTLERQTADGGWRRMLVPGHCHCDPPRHTGNAGFMVGILLHGLKLYYQATEDPKVAAAIVCGAEFLINDMWVDEGDGFRYTSCPHSSLCTDNFHRGIDGIAYAWRISRKSRFEPVLRHATQKAIDTLNPFGKSISASLRVAPNVLYDVAQLMN